MQARESQPTLHAAALRPTPVLQDAMTKAREAVYTALQVESRTRQGSLQALLSAKNGTPIQLICLARLRMEYDLAMATMCLVDQKV